MSTDTETHYSLPRPILDRLCCVERNIQELRDWASQNSTAEPIVYTSTDYTVTSLPLKILSRFP